MKKGIALSANFFVMLILALTALGMGLYLTGKVFRTAGDVEESIDRQTSEEIERLLYDGDRVSLPFSRKDIGKGRGDVFGLGLLNTLESGPEFTVHVEEGPLIMLDGTEQNPPLNGLGFIPDRTRKIKNNEFEILSLPVDVPRDALPGTYILNVFICNGTVADGACDGKLSGTGSNPQELYDGFVHKIYIRVK